MIGSESMDERIDEVDDMEEEIGDMAERGQSFYIKI